MLNRISANALLKSVIATLATLVVVMLAADAWRSWDRLATESRILSAADISGFAFTAMHNIRTDRAATVRAINAADAIDPQAQQQVRDARDAEMPAMRSAAKRLHIDFSGQTALLPELQQVIDRLTALQSESSDAFAKPKAGAPSASARS